MKSSSTATVCSVLFPAAKRALRTRNGKDWTRKFPVARDGHGKTEGRKTRCWTWKPSFVDEQGKAVFRRCRRRSATAESRRTIVAYAFDLLHLDGKDLTKLPLTERKEKLENLLKKSKQDRWLRYSAHIAGEGDAMFAKACEAGLEGIISKRANAPYVAGRQKSWLKIKCSLRQEFIILGFSDARTRRARARRALSRLQEGRRAALCRQGRHRLFDEKRARADGALRGDGCRRNRRCPEPRPRALPAGEWKSVHWIKPSLLCEVAFTEWTQDGHIRHPSFQGLREDKEAGT